MLEKFCRWCDNVYPDEHCWKNGIPTVWRCSYDNRKVDEMRETCDKWWCRNPY